MKDILRLFLKVQSVAVFMVRIYYPVEDIFLATVCLAYLPLCIWELFRKKISLFVLKKEMKLRILIIVMRRTNVKLKNAMILLLFSLLVML